MVKRKYYSAEWEWGCCGGPLAVGDEAELSIIHDPERLQELVEQFGGQDLGLDGIEAHHDDPVQLVRGRVTGLQAVVQDTEWTMTPRDLSGRPEPAQLGNGSFAVFGSYEPWCAEGRTLPGAPRIEEIDVIPDWENYPSLPLAADQTGRKAGQVVIRPELCGYLITLDVQVPGLMPADARSTSGA